MSVCQSIGQLLSSIRALPMQVYHDLLCYADENSEVELLDQILHHMQQYHVLPTSQICLQILSCHRNMALYTNAMKYVKFIQSNPILRKDAKLRRMANTMSRIYYMSHEQQQQITQQTKQRHHFLSLLIHAKNINQFEPVNWHIPLCLYFPQYHSRLRFKIYELVLYY